MGHTGIKPDIQGVADLVVVTRMLAQQFTGVQLKPGVDSLVFDAFRDFFD